MEIVFLGLYIEVLKATQLAPYTFSLIPIM